MTKPLRWIGVLASLALMGGCAGSGEGGADEPPAKGSTASRPTQWGNWQLVGKVKADSGYNGEFVPEFTVKNVGDEPDSGTFDVTFLKGDRVLGVATCNTQPSLAPAEVPPGKEWPVFNCDSSDDFQKGWTEVTFEDTF